MGVMSWFKNIVSQKLNRWKEIGTYRSNFMPFGDDLYASDLVRACIRPIAEHTSKANAYCTDKRIEKILNGNPNMYMNGKEFLQKVRTKLELQNTAFIYIMRDDKNHITGFYPVPYARFEAVEYGGRLFIRFFFNGNATRELVLAWDDLAVVRRDYNQSDIAGDDNTAIIKNLELINVTNQGVANAVKATANLRGILKSTKSILAPEDVKKNRDEFVKDYLNLENEGGIASLDGTQEFIPIKMEPTVTNSATMKEFRENVYRYFGVSDAIIMSTYTEEQMEAFYESKVEPFLVALSLELTRKVFTSRELGYGNQIIYESNRLQFSSMKTKISIFKEVVLYGGMTINEWRRGCNLAPLPGGDTPIRRLDAAAVDDKSPDDKEQPAEEGEEE